MALTRTRSLDQLSLASLLHVAAGPLRPRHCVLLEHKLKLDHDDLTTDSGVRCRVLALDPYAHHMSLTVLRRISELCIRVAP